MAKQIGALWTSKDKNGNPYLSGMIEDLRGEIRIGIFKNDKKEKESHPDYRIIVFNDEDKKPQQPKQAFFPEQPETTVEGLPF